MKKRFLLLLTAMLLFPILAGAQGHKPVIRFMPLIAEGIDYEEIRLIEGLIQSYLSDFGEVVNFFSPSHENILPDSPKDFEFLSSVPDYILSGSVYLERDNRIFTMEISTIATGETASYISVHKNTSELLLRARSLVEAAFPVRYLSAVEKNLMPEPLTERGIIGIWRGDPGIEMVRLQRSGQGVAIFSSGVRMDLRYAIEDNTLKIQQISPNNERFYHPLPFEIAKILSAEAEPISWELMLYEKGTTLRGIKRATDIRYEGIGVLEFLRGTVREVVWIKSAH
ncbi:MAG: hypothetical protein LBT93_07235 [Treponema sp.]|jgi:hypothetical protein|nr:hypothetical protein [Treponema sp.]